MKLACVDVAYQDDEAFAACLLFDQWTDASGAQSLVAHIAAVAPYEPGQFYRRELPCLLAALERSPWPLEMVVIDGYVWLGSEQRPGLGAHLYEALESEIPVIGVAKTAFIDTPAVEAIPGRESESFMGNIRRYRFADRRAAYSGDARGVSNSDTAERSRPFMPRRAAATY